MGSTVDLTFLTPRSVSLATTATKKTYDAEVMKGRIFGQHVSEYMAELEEEDATAYNKLFPTYIAAKIEPDNLEELLESVHEAIRKDPSPAAKSEGKVDKSFKR